MAPRPTGGGRFMRCGTRRDQGHTSRPQRPHVTGPGDEKAGGTSRQRAATPRESRATRGRTYLASLPSRSRPRLGPFASLLARVFDAVAAGLDRLGPANPARGRMVGRRQQWSPSRTRSWHLAGARRLPQRRAAGGLDGPTWTPHPRLAERGSSEEASLRDHLPRAADIGPAYALRRDGLGAPATRPEPTKDRKRGKALRRDGRSSFPLARRCGCGSKVSVETRGISFLLSSAATVPSGTQSIHDSDDRTEVSGATSPAHTARA